MNRVRCFISAIFCGLVASSAVADAAFTVTADAEKVTITAPAGVLDTSYDDLKLYLVWDAADRGSRIEDWPSANRIAYEGTLSADGGVYEINRASVPGLSTMRVIAAYDVRMIDGYVALTNLQYVNTGVLATEAYGVDIKFRYLKTYSHAYASLMSGVLDKFTIGRYNSNEKFYLRYRGRTGYNPAFTFSDTTWSDSKTITIKNQVAYLDGTSVQTGLASGSIGTIARPILIGGSWSSASPNTEPSGRCLNAEWHYATVFGSDGSKLAHLVPALYSVDGANIPCFVDVVSNRRVAIEGKGDEDYVYDTSASVTNTIRPCSRSVM